MDHSFGDRVAARRCLALVFANGFFVAAEFSIVDGPQDAHRPADRRRASRRARRAAGGHAIPTATSPPLSSGITMASIGLGWIGEPALASFIQPGFAFLPAPIAETTAHTIAVAIAFAIVTALHIVLGELAPKTIALEHAEATALLVVKPTEIVHEAVLAVHPPAERHGTRCREPAGHARIRAAMRWCTRKKS